MEPVSTEANAFGVRGTGPEVTSPKPAKLPIFGRSYTRTSWTVRIGVRVYAYRGE